MLTKISTYLKCNKSFDILYIHKTTTAFVSSLSHVWLFATPWTVACQATLSMEFSRQEHWNGLPFPSPGDLPHPGMEPESPALVCKFFFFFFTTEPPRKLKTIPVIKIMNISFTLKTFFLLLCNPSSIPASSLPQANTDLLFTIN